MDGLGGVTPPVGNAQPGRGPAAVAAGNSGPGNPSPAWTTRIHGTEGEGLAGGPGWRGGGTAGTFLPDPWGGGQGIKPPSAPGPTPRDEREVARENGGKGRESLFQCRVGGGDPSVRPPDPSLSSPFPLPGLFGEKS